MIAYPKKWNAVVPGSLVAIIFAIAAASMLDFDVARVGEIPKRCCPPSGSISPRSMCTPCSARVSGVQHRDAGHDREPPVRLQRIRMTGKAFNSDQELIAQGVGNIILPFFGGIPATAAIARTSVAVKSGAVTRVTGIVHALVLVVSMFLLAPVMSSIPLAALAGVLMVTAFRMNEWSAIRYMFSRKFKGAILKYFITMIATVIFDLTTAIALGVLVALLLLVRRLSKLEINIEAVDAERLSADGEEICRRYGSARVVYIAGAMIFANTQAVEGIPASIPLDCDAVFFSMRGVSYLDVSCAQR
jgi:SulP family sulfate permease